MIKGYKYYLSEDQINRTISVDSDIDDFGKDYMGADLLKILSTPWVLELHESLTCFINKDKLVVGIGSGVGEHELLFHLKGYNIIASDILPTVFNGARNLYPDFKIATIDIFKDSLPDVIMRDDYDLLDTGCLFYYNDDMALMIFKKFYDSLLPGSRLIIVSRYRDYMFANILERLLYLEAKLKAAIRKRGIMTKHHGYR